MGRTALIPWLVAITVSLVLWEPIFLHYLRRLLLFHSLLTNLWTSKWQLRNFLKVSENTFLHCFLLLKKKKIRETFQHELERQLSQCGLQITFGPATNPESLCLTGTLLKREIALVSLELFTTYSEVRTKELIFKFYLSH